MKKYHYWVQLEHSSRSLGRKEVEHFFEVLGRPARKSDFHEWCVQADRMEDDVKHFRIMKVTFLGVSFDDD